MESENMEMGAGSGGGPVNSRWNPTKEQISMLESLYRQGIRTPSADQIQQITGRLRAFGHIEGKNVFYWFQNHKARQRQKQKQESMAYVNRYLHNKAHHHHHHLHHQPVFGAPAPCSNVVCGSYYLPQTDLGFYPQYQRVLLPGVIKRRPRSEKTDKTRTYSSCTSHDTAPSHHDINDSTLRTVHETAMFSNMSNSSGINDQETLPLFPLHPTGVLQGREGCTTVPHNDSSIGIEEGSGYKPFFNFFHGQGQGPCESD